VELWHVSSVVSDLNVCGIPDCLLDCKCLGFASDFEVNVTPCGICVDREPSSELPGQEKQTRTRASFLMRNKVCKDMYCSS